MICICAGRAMPRQSKRIPASINSGNSPLAIPRTVASRPASVPNPPLDSSGLCCRSKGPCLGYWRARHRQCAAARWPSGPLTQPEGTIHVCRHQAVVSKCLAIPSAARQQPSTATRVVRGVFAAGNSASTSWACSWESGHLELASSSQAKALATQAIQWSTAFRVKPAFRSEKPVCSNYAAPGLSARDPSPVR